MKPEWFKFEEIPLIKHGRTIKYWLSFLLNGKNFQAIFYFGNKKLIDYQIEVCVRCK